MSESSAAAAPARLRAPRWVWIALIGSLALNCLVIGVVLRSVWQFRSAVGPGAIGASANLAGYLSSLPAGRREELRKIAFDERHSLRPLRLEVRRARSEAAQVFAAEPFDKDRFAAAQARLLEAETKIREAIQRSLSEIGAQMTTGERKAFLEWRDAHRPPPARWLADSQDEPAGKRRP